VILPDLANPQVLKHQVTRLFQDLRESLVALGCHPDQVFQHFLALHCLLLDLLVPSLLVLLEIPVDRLVPVIQLDLWVQMDLEVLMIQVHLMDLADPRGQLGQEDQHLLLDPADLMALVDLLILVTLPDPLVQRHHEDLKDQAVPLIH